MRIPSRRRHAYSTGVPRLLRSKPLASKHSAQRGILSAQDDLQYFGRLWISTSTGLDLSSLGLSSQMTFSASCTKPVLANRMGEKTARDQLYPRRKSQASCDTLDVSEIRAPVVVQTAGSCLCWAGLSGSLRYPNAPHCSVMPARRRIALAVIIPRQSGPPAVAFTAASRLLWRGSRRTPQDAERAERTASEIDAVGWHIKP